MTRDDHARKAAIRARMRTTGEPYSVAARHIDTDLGDAGLNDTYLGDTNVDSPPRQGDRVRLTYGDGSGCEGLWTLTPDGPVLLLDDGTVHRHTSGQVRRDVLARAEQPPLAERDWSIRARVRITVPYESGAPDSVHGRRFQPGEVLEMVQWGRGGRRIDRDSWWTSTDIDAAFIVPADHVDVLEVIADNPPTWAAAALGADRVVELFGTSAAAWPGNGVVVIDCRRHYEIRAVAGELLGLVDRDYQTGELTDPVQYRAVIVDDELAPRSVPMPGGFIPASPARTADGERIRWRNIPGVRAPETMRP